MRDWPRRIVPRYQRAVFLDRDGTLNRDTHYPHRIEELFIDAAVLQGLRFLARLPLHIIVVSNQAGIAKALFTEPEMSAFNAELRRRLESVGGRIDAFYFCPHLESRDLPPGSPVCRCSKPNPGMLEEAAADFHLDLPSCFMIGDKKSDVAAGQAVGATTILLTTGKAGRDEYILSRPPDVTHANLYQALEWVEEQLGTAARLKHVNTNSFRSVPPHSPAH